MPTRSELITAARAVYAAFAARDFASLEALSTPECVWEAPGIPDFMPWAGRHVGVVGAREFMDALDDNLIFKYFVPDSFHADSEVGTVFARGLAVCTVRETGRTYQNNFAHFFQFEGGKLAHFREYPDTVWQFIAIYPEVLGDLPAQQAARIEAAKTLRRKTESV